MQTLYDVLEISEKASQEMIEKAYKTLAKKYHPDLQNTPEAKIRAEETMKKLNEAYETLGDNEKRQEYDLKLEEERKINTENEKVEYNKYQTAPIDNTYYEETWQEKLARLTPKEQEEIKKNIEKNATEEYRKIYEDYFRSLGYKIKHKLTLKDILIIIIAIGIFAIIFYIAWLIPPAREWMCNLYQSNILVKVVVDIIKGIGIGFYKTIARLIQFK